MSNFYTLDENKAAIPSDVPIASRQVAEDTVGDLRILTTFLGVDVGWGGPPLLFETVAFHRDGTRRPICLYSTLIEAEAEHVKAVQNLYDNTRSLID